MMRSVRWLMVFGILLNGATALAKPKKKPALPPTVVHGTQDEARTLIEDMMRPSADLKAISKKLQPTTADYKAVIVGDAAAKAEAAYKKDWEAGRIVIAWKAEQSDLKLFAAKVEEIAAGQGDGNDFPGGYKKVVAQFKPGTTIYAWKFVRPGEKVGTEYDGLIWVNNHWVWFPKPWKAL